jgi:hypothetical protein
LAVRLSGALDGGALSLRSLDATSWRAAAMGDAPVARDLGGGTLSLAPFAVVQVEESR